MPEKSTKSSKSAPETSKSSAFPTFGEDSFETIISMRSVSFVLTMEGDPPEAEKPWPFLVIFNGRVVKNINWASGETVEIEPLKPLNLKEPSSQQLVAQQPLIFLLRTVGGKAAKDSDPLTHADNRAGATFDLLPFLYGEEKMLYKVPLIDILTGENTQCSVVVEAETTEPIEETLTTVPLVLTLLSIHCLPFAKDGTFYIGSIDLDDVLPSRTVNFGLSLSTNTASNVVWASASAGGLLANSAYSVPNVDKFVPEKLALKNNQNCRSFYWNAMQRVLVDPTLLKTRLSSPFFLEFAGTPRGGKIEVRGRYVGFLDAQCLLEPGQYGVSCCVSLTYYNESELPENFSPVLELPPSSAKTTARDVGSVLDEFGHNAYVVIKLDLTEPMVPKQKMAMLYEIIGFDPPAPPIFSVDELEVEPPPDDPSLDVRKIRREGGALAVHKELSGLACRGAVPMNQGIKRTAANRLLMRVRAMLKQFPPGDCSYIEWQDTVTGQHAASRRAVTASFAPQPPPKRPLSRHAAARSRIAGDTRLAEHHMGYNLKTAGQHSRTMLSKALRCLDERNDFEAKKYIFEGLCFQSSNRYLLWIFGGQHYDRGPEATELASAALRIAVKGDYSDGISLAIGWAAIHALHHYNNNIHSAFIAAKKMRKAFELPIDWKMYIKRWIEISGEEEVLWIPGVLSQDNPLILAAAFFLCLRCYNFCESILRCAENGCSVSGSRFNLPYKPSVDIYYIRAASLALRGIYARALEMTERGINKFGPSRKLTELKLTCLACSRNWDNECRLAMKQTEKSGAEICPYILQKAAMGDIATGDFHTALQRAARAHKLAPSGHSALLIARIYAKTKNEFLAEKWAAAAVKTEPLLADGWALLAILAMNEINVDTARTMLRTAYQAGPVSPDLQEEVQTFKDILQVRALPDSLVKNLCFCDYY